MAILGYTVNACKQNRALSNGHLGLNSSGKSVLMYVVTQFRYLMFFFCTVIIIEIILYEAKKK